MPQFFRGKPAANGLALAGGHCARSVGDGSSPNPRTAILCAFCVRRARYLLWSLRPCAAFRVSAGIYTLAIALLFAAGFFELSFNTMAQKRWSR